MHILIETLGWIGSVLIVGAYALNISGKVSHNSRAYLWANLVGSAFFVVNTLYHGAVPSAAVNVVWVGIALWGIWRQYSTKNQ
ncbi:MAG: hypothetical protein EAZ70_02445 [Runella slithyformis]|jgi:hypothetical protein|nr:MAG: hypothetical protein EAY79_02095 [Runella slithyformis]TAE98833.1 MAG: hypothetical protein EAZ80_05885 [Runella slithyformis]TAF29318.1 MAG: hypothetical protein EAZ70_02445 [Runella slithyformis]TAF48335.1 MAG: hypothetical protein EAZ63_05460 [Runella slithyformis]TAF83220.1 MAG: hypothetical protein EAZ50_01830 [Runella slithyformis]